MLPSPSAERPAREYKPWEISSPGSVTGQILMDADPDDEKDDDKDASSGKSRRIDPIPVAFTEMAKEAGDRIMANTVAVGPCLAGERHW